MKTEPTIYIVEDERPIRESLGTLLRREGWNCRAFGSAQQFLSSYQPETPGCLVLDLRLPGMDGLSLLRLLRERGHTLPVIILTGHGTIDQAVCAIKSGAVHFLEKPADPAMLVRTIRSVLAPHRDGRSRDDGHVQLIKERLALLSPREREILDLVVAGHTSAAIGRKLFIATGTVKLHRAHIMKKMGAASVAELVRMVMEAEAE